jgi:ABC-type phosphate transport system substrate-binding protein
MTRLPISLENRSRPVNIAVALMVILVTVLLAAGCTNNSEIPFEFTGSTTVIAQGATSVSDLAAKGVENPESLNIRTGNSCPYPGKRLCD